MLLKLIHLRKLYLVTLVVTEEEIDNSALNTLEVNSSAEKILLGNLGGDYKRN